MPVNPTNNEIDTKIDKLEQKLHDEFSVPPEIYVSLEALIKAKARSDQFRADTDERVQSIKEAKQEQLDKDIKILTRLLQDDKNKRDGREDYEGHPHYCKGCEEEINGLGVAIKALRELQQNEVD